VVSLAVLRAPVFLGSFHIQHSALRAYPSPRFAAPFFILWQSNPRIKLLPPAGIESGFYNDERVGKWIHYQKASRQLGTFHWQEIEVWLEIRDKKAVFFKE
jgi:hypothetical protein